MAISLKKNIFTDEFGEILKDTGRQITSLPKDIAKSAKGQILGPGVQTPSQSSSYGQPQSAGPQVLSGEMRQGSTPKEKGSGTKSKNKIDPVTGKPVPSKQMVTYLTNALQQRDLALLEKKRREILLELEKQRMKKVEGEEGEEEIVAPGEGPEIKKEKKKPNAQAISQMLKNAQTTGEAGKDTMGG